MKIKYFLSLGAILATCHAGAQTDPDTAMIMDYDTLMEAPVIMEEPMYNYDIMEATEAVAVPEIIDYNPVNKFKYNKKIKVEEKPDKKAVYSMGTPALLKEIADGVNVPYGYGAENSYVIVQFVVGKDSVLYNPEILFTNGAQYSINATDVIEKLMYQFSPATKNGKPVDSVVTIPVHFIRKDYTGNTYGKGRY